MDIDDDRPKSKRATPPDLSLLGVSELEGYIAGLEKEIARARDLIKAKTALRGDADSLFRQSS